jgi:hypothetical protein
MKRIHKFALLAGAAASVAVLYAPLASAEPQSSIAKDKDQSKDMNGKVTDKGDAPLKGAVVYLKNTKTLAVKSYISDDAGTFHFHALSPNVDYELYAEFNGQRSNTKTVSSFDTKTSVEMTLKIDAKR